MLKQEITFEDFDGNTRKTTLYFNMTEAELVKMQTESERGVDVEIEELQEEFQARPGHQETLKKLLAFVERLVQQSYGIKSDDGIHFRKSPEILHDFVSSAMYSSLLLNLFEEGGEKVTAFITGIMPAELVNKAAAQMQGRNPDVPTYQPSARERAEQFKRERNIPAPTQEVFNAPPTITPTQETQPQAFRVREEPIEHKSPEQEQFEEWKRQQAAQAEANSTPRPPHESGPGFIQQ